jgi:predicted DNA-binding protein (UPF0251 family)
LPGKIKSRLIMGSLPKSKIWVPRDCNSKDSEPLIDSQNSVTITVAEWETLRLCDLENYKQRDVAQIMHLSQPTVNRLLSRAHTKIAQALFNGKILQLESNLNQCPQCQVHFSTRITVGNVSCPNCGNMIKLI